MTFQQYIDNPMGKKNAVFTGREMYKAQYTEKFGQVNLREAGKLQYELFFDDRHDEFFCYMKIPSESLPNFYYDVVIHFYTKDNALRTTGMLNNYDVEFFSNDPAFVYTYAKVFKDNGMFIDDLKTRMPKLAMKQDPVERNAYKTPGYVKSIYFAFLYMQNRQLFIKGNYRNYGKKYSKSYLLSAIPPFESKMEDRNEKEREYKKAKADHKNITTDGAKSTKRDPLDPKGNIRTTKTVKTIGGTSRTSTTKKVGATKAVKRH